MATPLRSLLVAPIYAASIDTGGGQRTYHLYRSLARLGSVDILLVTEPVFADLEATLETLRAQFSQARVVRVHRSTAQFVPASASGASLAGRLGYALRRVHGALRPRSALYRPSEEAIGALRGLLDAQDHHVVVGRYLRCTALSGAFEQQRVPVVVDLDDLDEIVLRSRIGAPTTGWLKRLVLGHQARQTERVVQRLRLRCSHLFIASEADRRFVEHRSISVLPNIPLPPRASLAGAPVTVEIDDPVVLFVGSRVHRVNHEGLLRFVAACWPSISARMPAARLRVVGSGGWEGLREALEQTPGVIVVGRVDAVADEYAKAALCVSPLFEGSGTKIKVLEALAYGRPVVVASHSARGYEELVGHGIVVADDEAAMAEACLTLLGDPVRRRMLGASGQRLVEENHGFEALFGRFERALASAGIGGDDGVARPSPMLQKRVGAASGAD
jgi:glycosyltransferase involved in cell wall biosynthesis